MPAVMSFSAPRDFPKRHLKKETRQRIEKLLVRHEVDGLNRGLFSFDDLTAILDHMDSLAAWWFEHGPLQATSATAPRFDEKTVLCISYVDHIDREEKDVLPAVTLQEFFNKHFSKRYSHLHILPHFLSPRIHPNVYGPAARADGGFELLHYKMDPAFGAPEDLRKIKANLMFDFVLNHLSTKGDLFKRFLKSEPGYEDAFLHFTDEEVSRLDLSAIFRPREHNPIVPFVNEKGEKKNVWCTFSSTQADLNIFDPNVFPMIMESLVKDFMAEGAKWIRLDAIGYLVKMLGVRKREALTSCFGIAETHNVLKAIRCFLDDISPNITLLPEVNAKAKEIATYFGHDGDEGHIVYDFPSAPTSLLSLYQEDAEPILYWAQHRAENPDQIGLAFTSTHDGIGVLPLLDIPNIRSCETALDFFIHQLESRGGAVNHKATIINGQTLHVPYEVCITWAQAILTPEETAALKSDSMSSHELALIVDRFMASQALIFAGPHCVPGDYMGSITALLNDEELYQIAGHKRNKNRSPVKEKEFDKAIQNPETNYEWFRHMIFQRKNQMISARQNCAAFSPYAPCLVDIVVPTNAGLRPIYSILRRDPEGLHDVLVLTNCSSITQKTRLKRDYVDQIDLTEAQDILAKENDESVVAKDGTLTLAPYQTAWLKLN